MGLPLVVSDYREKKILKRFKVTPTSPMMILGVQLVIYAIYSIVSLMLIFSGATLPYEVIPTAMESVANIMPLTQGIKVLKATSLGLPVENIVLTIITMIFLAIICTGVSLKFFKWE